MSTEPKAKKPRAKKVPFMINLQPEIKAAFAKLARGAGLLPATYGTKVLTDHVNKALQVTLGVVEI